MGSSSDGKIKPLKVFPSKEEAIKFAKDFVSPFGIIEIHNTDDTTGSRVSIGKSK